MNVLRLSLHPEGLAPRITNLRQWRSHLLTRLRQQIEVTADPVLDGLLRELRDYPICAAGAESVGPETDYGGVAVPLRLVTDSGPLALLSTTTVFGTPVEVTLSELALEAFFPADADTADRLRSLAGSSGRPDRQ